MLPVARGDGHLRGGFGQFIKRRAWRILPPYYAAVVLSLILIRTMPFLEHSKNGLWRQALPAFAPGVLVSHLLLYHNWSKEWLLKIDYPLWSVATEWQIYIVFGLLLLPMWRRFGLIWTIAGAFALAYLPDFIFHHRITTEGLHLLVLFAFGMCSAVIAVSKDVRRKIIEKRALIGSLCAVGLLFTPIVARRHPEMLSHVFSYHDIPVGIATAVLLPVLMLAPRYRAANFAAMIVRILECRPLVVLGTFSYSLYLIHAPILAIVFYYFYSMHISAIPCFVACEFIGVLICLCCSYIFHLIFERPFMSKPSPKTERQVELAAIVSPAP